jgi:hypothetical protein
MLESQRTVRLHENRYSLLKSVKLLEPYTNKRRQTWYGVHLIFENGDDCTKHSLDFLEINNNFRPDTFYYYTLKEEINFPGTEAEEVKMKLGWYREDLPPKLIANIQAVDSFTKYNSDAARVASSMMAHLVDIIAKPHSNAKGEVTTTKLTKMTTDLMKTYKEIHAGVYSAMVDTYKSTDYNI